MSGTMPPTETHGGPYYEIRRMLNTCGSLVFTVVDSTRGQNVSLKMHATKLVAPNCDEAPIFAT